MKKLLLATTALACLGAYASAQVNSVPQIGVISSIQKQNTYSAASVNLVPAASATDIFCISDSATKSVSIKNIDITGIATAANDVQFTLLHRQTLDTGGTNATGVSLATPTANITPSAAPTATISAFTANPTIVDTSPAYLRNAYLTLPTSVNYVPPLNWSVGTGNTDFLAQGIDLTKAVPGEYCINMNGVTVTATLAIDITWTEN